MLPIVVGIRSQEEIVKLTPSRVWDNLRSIESNARPILLAPNAQRTLSRSVSKIRVHYDSNSRDILEPVPTALK